MLEVWIIITSILAWSVVCWYISNWFIYLFIFVTWTFTVDCETLFVFRFCVALIKLSPHGEVYSGINQMFVLFCPVYNLKLFSKWKSDIIWEDNQIFWLPKSIHCCYCQLSHNLKKNKLIGNLSFVQYLVTTFLKFVCVF